MPLKRTTFEVAFMRDGDVVETEVEVWAVDELRAETEARRQGLKGTVVDREANVITDLGDVRNRQALEIWAALTRTEQYADKAMTFRREHCIGFEDLGKDKPVDPTQPEVSTDSD